MQRGWTLTKDDTYIFEDDKKKETSLELPSHKITQNMLEYAKELERIV